MIYASMPVHDGRGRCWKKNEARLSVCHSAFANATTEPSKYSSEIQLQVTQTGQRKIKQIEEKVVNTLALVALPHDGCSWSRSVFPFRGGVIGLVAPEASSTQMLID